jgi:mannosyltransferase
LVSALLASGERGLWLDEAGSVYWARSQKARTMLSGRGGNMGLYTCLLHFWIKVFGESETAVRSLSVMLGAPSVPAVYVVGRQLFDDRTGLLAALLLALDPYFLARNQEARSYPLLITLVTFSGYFFIRELDHPSRANQLGYVVSSAAALDAHYFAAFVYIPQAFTVLALKRRAAFRRTWLGVATSIVVLGLPEAIHVLDTGSGPIKWVPPPTDSLRAMLVSLRQGAWPARAVLLTGCGVALARAIRVGNGSREAFLAGWLAAPVVLSFGLSFIQPMFLPRYLVVSVPPLVLLAARGLTRLPASLLRAAVIAAGCSNGRQLSLWYRARPLEDWRAVTRYVRASMRPGDTILWYPDYAQWPFEYYERRHPGPRPERIAATLPPLASSSRAWVVIRVEDAVRDPAGLQTLEQALMPRYRISERQLFSGVQVVLYTRKA